MKKKVLLLNPPGERLYIRDGYCSKTPKTNYLNQPADLVILSGILYEHYDVSVIDAMIQQISFDDCFKIIKEINPDIIVFLSGIVCWKNDFKFMKRLKENSKPIMIGSGDIFLGNSVKILRDNDFLDAILLDYATRDIVKFIEGKYEIVENMVFKKDNGIIERFRTKNQFFDIPMPRHELFKNNLYYLPFIERHPFAYTALTYGCPFQCSFCITATVGFKIREIDKVIEEMKYIKSLGIKEIYWGDGTFTVNRKKTEELCAKMIENNFNFGWLCYTRVDTVDSNLLRLMRKAGCHTIIFGVESGDDKVLARCKKGFTTSNVKDIFAVCRKIGIKTVGTFIIGLPGDDKKSCIKTIKFAKEIKCDYASFNTPVPKQPTELYNEVIRNGWISFDVEEMDQTGTVPAIRISDLSKEDLWWLRLRSVVEFYMRPMYLLKRLVSLRTSYEFFNSLRFFYWLLAGMFKFLFISFNKFIITKIMKRIKLMLLTTKDARK